MSLRGQYSLWAQAAGQQDPGGSSLAISFWGMTSKGPAALCCCPWAGKRPWGRGGGWGYAGGFKTVRVGASNRGCCWGRGWVEAWGVVRDWDWYSDWGCDCALARDCCWSWIGCWWCCSCGEAASFLLRPQDWAAQWICRSVSSASLLACFSRSAWPWESEKEATKSIFEVWYPLIIYICIILMYMYTYFLPL